MRKLIAAINMTLDGFCDHTAMIADEEIHQHYNELLSKGADFILRKFPLNPKHVLELFLNIYICISDIYVVPSNPHCRSEIHRKKLFSALFDQFKSIF